jgi:hypothetical protein
LILKPIVAIDYSMGQNLEIEENLRGESNSTYSNRSLGTREKSADNCQHFLNK